MELVHLPVTERGDGCDVAGERHVPKKSDFTATLIHRRIVLFTELFNPENFFPYMYIP